MQLYFIRHGQSMNNAHWQEPTYKESPDPALTETGIEQARLLADFLEKFQPLTQPEGWDVHHTHLRQLDGTRCPHRRTDRT